MQNPMEQINKILDDPYAYLRQLSFSKKIMGYSCTYAPIELIYASGFHPARIIGLSKNISFSDVHLQSYACSITRTLLEDSLSKKLDFLSAFLFVHTCDSMQRLSDIFRLNLNFEHFDLILPVKLDSQTSKAYFKDILIDFKKKLEETQQVQLDRQKLSISIQTYNHLRKNLIALYNIKSSSPSSISFSDLSNIVRASMIMDPKEFIQISSYIIQNTPQAENSQKKRLLITGNVCINPDIFQTVENKNAFLIWDDLCTGTRFFEELADEYIDPIEAIAQRLIKRPLCPAKYINPTKRIDYLKNLVKNHAVDGVIFLFIKFCEPHSFDYPDQKKMLEKMNIPTIIIEIENQNMFDEQTKTRLETFVEMLDG